MAADHPIESFPPDADRDAFGNWLSGFTDGEGCFYLKMALQKRQGVADYHHPVAGFFLGLRADDREVLEMIRRYFGVGILKCHAADRYNAKVRAKPALQFIISRWVWLADLVVPHFEKYPLRAKKAKDFSIWRQAVELGRRVSQRKKQGKYGGGTSPAWEAHEIERFRSLHDALRKQREYEPGAASSQQLTLY